MTTQAFEWTPVQDADAYILYIGTTPGAHDVLADGLLTQTTRLVTTSLPADVTLYAQALAEAKEAELWYQESFRKFVIPDRMDDAHPTLQPGFRAMADRLAKVTWEGLVRETLAFGSPDTVARHIETMRDLGVGQVMCWMNFGGLAQDKVRRSMELFARDVMPRFL